MIASLLTVALVGPIVVHDARETSPLTSVDGTAPVVYERAGAPVEAVYAQHSSAERCR